MELFYSKDVCGNVVALDQDEATHCIKVLRHRAGDEIQVIDGQGTLFRCRLTDDNWKHAEAEILASTENWGAHPYDLTLAVCPTKNMDRYEWMAEKVTEMGTDTIVPLIGDHSERRIFKPARLEKILVSATKQSLKAKVPAIAEEITVKRYVESFNADDGILKLIAYCFEGEGFERTSVKKALETYKGNRIVILIGPEGDFSKEEAEAAFSHGFQPVHLGNSRLRTETAGVVSASAVYFRYME